MLNEFFRYLLIAKLPFNALSPMVSKFCPSVCVTPYHSCGTLPVQTLQHLYIDSTNHHCESAQNWCCHSSTTLCLCCSYLHAQWLLFQSHPYYKQRSKRKERILQVHFFHFLLILHEFITSSPLDPVISHCLFQGSFHQESQPNSVSQATPLTISSNLSPS